MSAVEERSVSCASAAGLANYPWQLIGLLWTAAFLNSAGRQILITVLPQVRAEFGLSATQLALINSVGFWIYAVCALIFGRLGDATHRSRLIVGGLAFWAVATGMVSVATGLIALVMIRGLVAAGEATYYPTAAALISDWHRSGTRSRALSIHQTGVFAGAGVGAVAAGALADAFGWRSPFLIFGILALVFCAVLFKWLRDPAAAPSQGVAPSAASSTGPLRTVLRKPAALMLCLVFFLANGAVCGIIVWAPTFLHDELGLDLAASALYGSATLSAAGVVCVPLGGFLAHRLAARTPLAVFDVLAIGLALAGLLLLPLRVATTAFAVGAVLFASGAGKGLFDGCIYAAMHDVVPPAARATAVGLMTLVGFCGAGLSPIAVAQVSGWIGMAPAVTSLAFLYLAAAVLLIATRSSTRQAILETREIEDRR
ncbi:MAG TPA: MFS transporter [Burkholderiales bacterium]|nr:MFS transporter [Burkholderiales bacterium]